jgi:hypothetical protein
MITILEKDPNLALNRAFISSFPVTRRCRSSFERKHTGCPLALYMIVCSEILAVRQPNFHSRFYQPLTSHYPGLVLLGPSD